MAKNIIATRKRLTIFDGPTHRVSNDRYVLHYKIKEISAKGKWLSAEQVAGLRLRGIRVEYGK